MNIDFKQENYRFNARASAIIYNKNKTKILLFKVKDGRDTFMLPGGRIEHYEDSKTAIKREIKEELGYDLEFEICSIQENFLEKDNIKSTQYCFCYKSIYNGIIENNKFVCKDNNNIYFYWIDIDKLSNYKIVPNSTYNLIINDYNHPKHIIERIN